MKLRPFQQDAVDSAIKHMCKSTGTALIEAATGAGKSHIISALAQWLHQKSGKKILCLAPTRELVTQNYNKYIQIDRASIYCASAGEKKLVHPVIFCSPITTNNGMTEILKMPVAGIIIDEAHGITPTILNIVESVKALNPNVRIIGLSATPYRTGKGYIYGYDATKKRILSEDEALNPFFEKMLYRITANELIEMGYLTPPSFCEQLDHYDTSGLIIDKKGQFTVESLEKCYEGKGRLTATIITDIVAKSANRKSVLIFAATIKHAEECIESLPTGAQLVTGGTKNREKILSSFKNGEFKYLVNVGVLTTGFDAPIIDHIAVLRATESPGLFQQIIGRGTRLCDGKDDFLVSDYAENIERHGLTTQNVFNPIIKTKKQGDIQFMPVSCPECDYINQFAMKPNPDKMPITGDGYFTDLLGVKIEPAHFGRRCKAAYDTGECGYFFVSKECDYCQAENDIAAKFCGKCYAELCDPNKPLTIDTASTFAKLVPVVAAHEYDHISKAGNQCKKVVFALADKSTAIKYYSPNSAHKLPQREYKKFKEATLPYSLKLTQVGENWEVTWII